jgi:hypothetical protein
MVFGILRMVDKLGQRAGWRGDAEEKETRAADDGMIVVVAIPLSGSTAAATVGSTPSPGYWLSRPWWAHDDSFDRML